jgi:hypothetical protein
VSSFKQSLAACAGLALVIVLVAFATPARTQGQGGGIQQPLKVSVVGVVQTQAAVPPRAFNVSLNGAGPVFGPDPEGTSYAITSFTVANFGSDTTQVDLRSVYGMTSDCRGFSYPGDPPLDPGDSGPVVSVAAGETLHLTFPQPILLPAKPGAASCLVTVGSPGAFIYVVGYRY